MKHYVVHSESDAMTRAIAKEFAHSLRDCKIVRVIALSGDLGAGKTTFTKGFLNYFGVRPRALSPTFVLAKHYVGKVGAIKKDIYHIDAYRLSSKKDLRAIGFENMLGQKNSIVLIEWPEKVRSVFSLAHFRISFEYGEKKNERKIFFIKK